MNKKNIILLGVGVLFVNAYIFIQPIKQFLINTHAVDLMAQVRSFGEVELPDEETITTLNYKNIPIVVSKKDRCVCMNIRVRGTWEPHMSSKIVQLARPGDRVVEIGANYGYYTLQFLDRIGPQGQLYAYEANPIIHRALSKSCMLNNFENAQLYNVAVSNHTQTSFIHYNFQNLGGGFISLADSKNGNACPPGRCQKVRTVTLDQHLQDLADVGLIKIDAEGSEILILKAAEKLIDRSPDVLIAMEWNPSMMRVYEKNIQGFVGFLEQKGFQFLEISLSGDLKLRKGKELMQQGEGSEIILFRPTSQKRVERAFGISLRPEFKKG